jgi:hypothetical protein
MAEKAGILPKMREMRANFRVLMIFIQPPMILGQPSIIGGQRKTIGGWSKIIAG